MHILDLYTARFGAAVKRQGGAWNGPCPLCGGEPGKSDRFMIWPERSANLGETCATHNVTGIWSCRKCGFSGDTIAYLMKIEGMAFKTALIELGIEGGRATHRRRRAPAEPRSLDAVPVWTPRECPTPSEEWSTYAAKLLVEAEERILQEPAALHWLASRGITIEAVRRYRIGYLPAESTKYSGRWRYRSALGLEPKQADDGTLKQKMFIPRGIVIPTFAPASSGGRVINLRIRRHKEDLQPLPGGKLPAKYMELEGSCKAPLFLRSSRHGSLAAYFVTEAELDAMLIHFATNGVIGALAVRTNRGKPDVQTHARLHDAVRVCVALDYDEPGADGVDFWERVYPTSLRWPTPEGKDPGDAYRLGVDIREWVAASLPSSIALPDDACRQNGDEPRSGSEAIAAPIASDSECPVGCGAKRHLHGQTDTLLSGLLDVGGGVKPETALPEKGSDPAGLSEQMRTSGKKAETDGLSDDERSYLHTALPGYLHLSDVPEDVARAFFLWQGLPVVFRKNNDGAACEFGWYYKHDQIHAKNRLDALLRLQHDSPCLWRWLSDHVDTEITYTNLLHVLGA